MLTSGFWLLINRNVISSIRSVFGKSLLSNIVIVCDNVLQQWLRIHFCCKQYYITTFIIEYEDLSPSSYLIYLKKRNIDQLGMLLHRTSFGGDRRQLE